MWLLLAGVLAGTERAGDACAGEEVCLLQLQKPAKEAVGDAAKALEGVVDAVEAALAGLDEVKEGAASPTPAAPSRAASTAAPTTTTTTTTTRSTVVAATRNNACKQGDLRLRQNGYIPEIYVEEKWESYVAKGNGKWRPLCGPYFWDNNHGADNFCKQLGYSSGTITQKKFRYGRQAWFVGRCSAGEDVAKEVGEAGACTAGGQDQAGPRVPGKPWSEYSNIINSGRFYGTKHCNEWRDIGIRITCEGAGQEGATCQDAYPVPRQKVYADAAAVPWQEMQGCGASDLDMCWSPHTRLDGTMGCHIGGSSGDRDRIHNNAKQACADHPYCAAVSCSTC